MAIKNEALSNFSGHFNESTLANKLDEVFDITFRKNHGDLSFWIGEPKSNIRERFGLHQEVLIIYSSHIKTDARVLTAIRLVLI